MSVKPETTRLGTPARLGLNALGDQVPLLALVLLCLFTTIMSSRFLSPININNVLLQVSIYAIITIGMTFVIVGRGFDLSVGSVVALSGCGASFVMLELGVVAGFVAGIGLGALVGLINGISVAKLKVNPFIATLATMVMVRGAVYLITGGVPVVGDEGLPRSFLNIATARFLGLHYLIWVPLILFVVFAWALHRTTWGTRIFAVGGNPEAAHLAGINTERVTASTYVLCSSLAGLAGVLLASRLQSGQPTAGEFYELTAIAAVTLGGASLHGGEGKLYKSMIGVFIMLVLANSLNLMNVHSYWQRVAEGVVILLAAAADQWRRRRRK